MQQSPKLLDLYQSLINDISEQTKSFTILQSLANKLKRKPGELLLVFLVVISMLTSTGFLGHYFTVFIGIILGVFRTIKVIICLCSPKNQEHLMKRING